MNFERFVADRRVRQLVERNLEIISEVSRRIPDRLKAGRNRMFPSERSGMCCRQRLWG